MTEEGSSMHVCIAAPPTPLSSNTDPKMYLSYGFINAQGLWYLSTCTHEISCRIVVFAARRCAFGDLTTLLTCRRCRV